MKQKLPVFILVLLYSFYTNAQTMKITDNDVVLIKSDSTLSISNVSPEVLAYNGFKETIHLTFYKTKGKVVRMEYTQPYSEQDYKSVSLFFKNGEPILYETKEYYVVRFEDGNSPPQMILQPKSSQYKIYFLNIRKNEYRFCGYNNKIQDYEEEEVDENKMELIQSTIQEINYYLGFKDKTE